MQATTFFSPLAGVHSILKAREICYLTLRLPCLNLPQLQVELKQTNGNNKLSEDKKTELFRELFFNDVSEFPMVRI
ncbi:CLUMA_CG001101, isoform A [Clunio marinus]|uniref:CLUMA_CG001101, isoform A n=1 Tax=Clunio marinus TaxID=568069 RepID=A0A1J1HHE6_9DIPT|nr:CLUMA_CG001101, isoform A [Clunio marinus]